MKKGHFPTILALGFQRPAPTLGSGGEKSVVGEDVETLKRRLPLLDYLRQHNWTGHPASRSELVGLCRLHEETRPSFYVNTRKDVFYCHGCGQGGDLIRFVQLSRRQSFRQSLACLDPHTAPEADPVAVLEQAAAFWQFSGGAPTQGRRSFGDHWSANGLSCKSKFNRVFLHTLSG